MNARNNNKSTQKELKIIMWNINGLGGKHRYIQTLINEADPDVLIISETKLKRPIVPHLYIGCDGNDAVQL